MLKKEKPMMSVTAIIQGAQAQQWSRNFAGLGPQHFHLGLSLDQNLSMGSLGPQSPLEMKPDTASLLTSGQFSPPQGPNSPGSFSLSHGNMMSPTSGNQNQKGSGSSYPPNHPLSGSKHLCSICGDRASGKHYGVYSCEGCKGFFKRTVRKDLSYACREEKVCIIDKRQRNRCQYCRYQKCLAMGMKREAVQEERQRTKERDNSEVESTSNLHTDMSIERLLEAEKRADRKCEERQEYDNGIVGVYGVASNIQVVHMIEWVKNVPHFSTLPLQDRILLFRAGWNELLLAEVSHKSMDLKDSFILENGLVLQRSAAQDMKINNIYDRIITELIAKLREMKMDRAELSCLRCIILYNPDVRGIKAVSEVEMLREKVYGVLEEYCRTSRPDEPGRFAKLLLRLPALRSIGLKCIEYICYNIFMGDMPIETFLMGIFDTQPPDI